MKRKLIGIGAAIALGACNAPDERGSNQTAAAQGKAEDGRVTVKAPGVDISLRIPEAARSRMATRGNSEILPPGARIGGVHVQGNAVEGGSGGDGSVELSFASDEAPERLAAWYRDPARAPHFAIASDAREGGALVLGGTTRENGGRFTVRLAPRPGGGTDGRLLLADGR